MSVYQDPDATKLKYQSSKIFLVQVLHVQKINTHHVRMYISHFSPNWWSVKRLFIIEVL